MLTRHVINTAEGPQRSRYLMDQSAEFICWTSNHLFTGSTLTQEQQSWSTNQQKIPDKYLKQPLECT